MEFYRGFGRLLLGWLIVFLVAGCSGNGGIDGSGSQPKTTIEGTAAVGFPIKNTNIYVKGKLGNRTHASTDGKGKFTIDVTSLTAPYVLKTTLPGGKSLYSLAMKDGVANINPLTNLLAQNLFASNSRELADDFSADEGFSILPTELQFSATLDAINKLLQVAYQQFMVPDGFNFLTSRFDADQNTFDGLLDHLSVRISDGMVTVSLRDPVTNIAGYLIVDLNISFDFTQADTTPPSQPTGLTPIAASTQNIMVVWESSTDNVGVAGYNLYRDGVKIATTSMPIYNDSALAASTEYCYSVEAFDENGKLSDKSVTACATTLAAVDIIAPTQVATLSTSNVTTSSITLDWSTSVENDVLGYDIYRKTDGNFSRVATTVANSYVDTDLDAATTYCYSIQAFDSALNPASSSVESCATTETLPSTTPDTDAPVTSAIPGEGSYDGPRTVILSCYDNGGSGCAATFYTVDGITEPTVDSTLYTGGILISSSTVLKYFSIDNAGNPSSVTTSSYTIAPPPPVLPVLSIVNTDSIGVVSSDTGGIDCGAVCEASFPVDSQVTLTAMHANGLVAVWEGCTSTVVNECTVQMSRSRTVDVSFVSITSESASNDTFATSQQVLDVSIISGYYNAVDDLDYYRIDVTKRGTFKAVLSHPTAKSYLALLDSNYQVIVSSGGCCGAAVNTLTQSLDPGTYYVRVTAAGVADLSVPYSLTLSGTVLGGPTPDVYEENDSFATATPITGNGSVEGFLDTANDADFFTFTVTARSTFKAVEAHATALSFLTLYNDQFQSIVSAGGCCGATTNALTQSLDPGVYYLRVLSSGASDLTVPYTLTLSGTALGGTTPDIHEENDSFATATPVTDNANYQGYLDTANDADFYVLNATVAGVLTVSVSHPTATSFVALYDDKNQVLVTSGGCCGATAHTLTYTVITGTYYVRVLSNGVSDLKTPYDLSIAAIQ